MKKKIVGVVVALLLVGAGTIYAFHGGYVRFGAPAQEDITAAVSQAAESATQKAAEEFAQASAAQAEGLEALRAQVEQLSDKLQASSESEVKTPPNSSASSAPAASVPESVPAVASSIVQVSSPAPPPPPTKVENAGTVFEGHTVTVTDRKTPAIRAAGTDWPITTYYFISANEERLGSISGTAMNAIIKKFELTLDADEEWEFWFAEQFNVYRNLTGNALVETSPESSGTGSSANKTVDTEAFASEVIALINQKREEEGLLALEEDSALTSHSVLRAEELEIQYSHVRPDGTKEKSECIVMRRDSPAAAVKAWLDSAPHRDAILNESGRFDYHYIGSGCYQDEKGVLYWVITFAV